MELNDRFYDVYRNKGSLHPVSVENPCPNCQGETIMGFTERYCKSECDL